MNEFLNHRCFFLQRFYYEYRHELIKSNGKLVKDTVFDAFGKCKTCYFYYKVNKPNFKIIKEVVIDYRINEKRKILYKIDYNKRTERQIYCDKDDYAFLDLKYHFDQRKNIIRVDNSINYNCVGSFLFRDYNGDFLKTDGYYFPIQFIPKVLKMTKKEIQALCGCNNLYRKI